MERWCNDSIGNVWFGTALDCDGDGLTTVDLDDDGVEEVVTASSSAIAAWSWADRSGVAGGGDLGEPAGGGSRDAPARSNLSAATVGEHPFCGRGEGIRPARPSYILAGRLFASTTTDPEETGEPRCDFSPNDPTGGSKEFAARS